MIFHTHYFKESKNDKDIIYCHCGEVKDIHKHIWEFNTSLVKTESPNSVIGRTLKCKICGQLKNFYI